VQRRGQVLVVDRAAGVLHQRQQARLADARRRLGLLRARPGRRSRARPRRRPRRGRPPAAAARRRPRRRRRCRPAPRASPDPSACAPACGTTRSPTSVMRSTRSQTAPADRRRRGSGGSPGRRGLRSSPRQLGARQAPRSARSRSGRRPCCRRRCAPRSRGPARATQVPRDSRRARMSPAMHPARPRRRKTHTAHRLAVVRSAGSASRCAGR
jgi:hypothetical protein